MSLKKVENMECLSLKKQNVDLDKIELLSYLKTKNDDEENSNKTIHIFTYDWNFETVYAKPEQALEKLDQYYALLTPEFSTFFKEIKDERVKTLDIIKGEKLFQKKFSVSSSELLKKFPLTEQAIEYVNQEYQNLAIKENIQPITSTMYLDR